MATKETGILRNIRLLGYVRVENKDDIFLTSQDSTLEAFASKEGLDLAQIEHEVSNGKQLARLGLWKALRLVACLDCEPKQMPMLDYDSWFREALKPCTCKHPIPLAGILVVDIGILCTTPAQGSQFVLDMCLAKKHLFVSKEKRCLSCCNPQAIEFLRKQTLK